MDLSRRRFFKVAGAAGAAAVVARPTPVRASESAAIAAERRGVLVDTTKCIGCRGCEAACSETNRTKEPEGAGQEAIFLKRRTTDQETYTVVNRYTHLAAGKTRFVKTQCMHCVEPACASACLARALDKTPTGPVIYHPERCLGCRYCMVACPFGVPKYEYNSATPLVRKCQFCYDRQEKGEAPACASVCPSGALQFGKREELLEVARTRIYQNPDRYVHHVYGEHEVGGTSWMYITDVPFDTIGFRTDLGEYAYSSLTQASLAAVPFVITLWPPLLMGIYTFSQRRDQVQAASAAKEARHE
jgi:formate dehydrogenase iron-sulfur subunit